ncbi:trace amine-associated receptor 2-like [Montipora capricornis]|uniref:trace amine-associated receptor 2-like n=1 Tax=Montipora capricornis TaxID=246305 RepID=UPI0035F1F5A4
MNGEEKDVFSLVFVSITIIVNTIACPFTIGLNMLVIIAIKRKRRLQNNGNIMLACLAVTDVLTGLTSQPSFILWKTASLLGSDIAKVFYPIHRLCIIVLSYSSALHLMMVVGDKMIAIKYPFWYPSVMTTRNIKMGVLLCWVYSSSFRLPIQLIQGSSALYFISVSHIFFVCVVFVSTSNVILYFETRRHHKMIKAQQLPQEQVETFLKENKAFKTTVLVVGAVGLCLLPAIFILVMFAVGFFRERIFLLNLMLSMTPTFMMINSLLNPLIYCWRQKEIRKFVFRTSMHAVHPVY